MDTEAGQRRPTVSSSGRLSGGPGRKDWRGGAWPKCGLAFLTPGAERQGPSTDLALPGANAVETKQSTGSASTGDPKPR